MKRRSVYKIFSVPDAAFIWKSHLLQSDCFNQGTWKKMVQSQRFLRTKDFHGIRQADQ